MLPLRIDAGNALGLGGLTPHVIGALDDDDVRKAVLKRRKRSRHAPEACAYANELRLKNLVGSSMHSGMAHGLFAGTASTIGPIVGFFVFTTGMVE